MRLKRYGHCPNALLPRPPYNLLQDVRMGAVYSIKVPDTHQRGPKLRRYFVKLVKNLHPRLLSDGFSSRPLHNLCVLCG